MIKRNQSNARQKLLRKNSDESTSQYPPFEIEECYSAVDYNQKDHSYYCLENQSISNPYFIEMTEMSEKGQQKPRNNNQFKIIPKQITMNGNHYERIDTEPEKKRLDEVKALCGHCRTMQLIPRNSTKFICFNCRTFCKCTYKNQPKHYQVDKLQKQKYTTECQTPKKKLFICGSCSVKVSYQPGLSQYIKCSKCNTINMVPK